MNIRIRAFGRFAASLVLVLVTVFAAPVSAQDFRGRINGIVTTVNYLEVTGILDPPVARIGVRFDF